MSEQVRKAAVRKEMLPFAYIIQAVFLPPHPLSSVPKSNLEANQMLTHLAYRYDIFLCSLGVEI